VLRSFFGFATAEELAHSANYFAGAPDFYASLVYDFAYHHPIVTSVSEEAPGCVHRIGRGCEWLG
jgi:hypothetical protein